MKKYCVTLAAAVRMMFGILQDKIWEEHNLENREEQEFLSDLAYNLNFYDPLETDVTLGYYGNERLSEIVSKAIQTLQTFIK